jgi:hypothetical protein
MIKTSMLWAGFLLFTCVGCSPNAPSKSQVTAAPQAAADGPKADKQLREFSCLKGTAIAMAAVESNSKSWDESYSSGYEGRQIHNYVFLDTASATFAKLFSENNQVITQTQSYPNPPDVDRTPKSSSPADCEQSSDSVRWIVYSIVKSDTNQNKQLDSGDLAMVGISTANGENYTALIPDVQQIYGQVFQPQTDRLIMIYKHANTKKMSTIDLKKRSIVSTQPVIDLGPDVK